MRRIGKFLVGLPPVYLSGSESPGQSASPQAQRRKWVLLVQGGVQSKARVYVRVPAPEVLTSSANSAAAAMRGYPLAKK